ncbi:MAG TPA: putative aminohydrolase SsnA [Kiritimatiellia bacterium]|nr:putative aminohydrolase SsnA [Kiritimatiellia bacterium]HMP00109.1 putative aminohydrolase SsnA [Kiritimatiellia bacterium]HMP96570.1 putative aminohydrolase SsnA [Kiritimatiellia bacterium]
MTSLLITNGTLVTLNDEGAIIHHGSVLIQDGVITAAGHLDGVSADRVIDAGGRIVMPGLINAHHHLYSTLARGFSPPGEPATNFKEILERLWWKLDYALNADDVYYSSMLPMVEAIRAGCTTIIDHHASPSCCDGSLDIVERAFREAGLSGCLCYEVSDRNKIGEGIEENIRFIRKCQEADDPQLAALFGLHASMTLGPETLERCAAAGEELGVGFHVHIDEAECDGEESLELFGARPVDRFVNAGIAGPGSLFAHGIHLDDRGWGMLAETGTMMVTNPESNMNNGLAVTPLLELLHAGILIGLGTDGMSNSLIAQARAAYLIQRAVRLDPRVAFVEACRLLLTNNRLIADRVFGEPRGRLVEGHLGDVIIMDYRPFTPFDESTFYGHLLFGLVNARVTTTIARGRVLMENGVITHLDEEAICRKATEAARALWKRIA